MEDTLIKPENQPVWYENDELIKEYLESPRKSSNTKAVSRKEKMSLLKLIKTTIEDQSD